MTHFAATIGLPSAALVAMCVVVLLERTSGTIAFEAVGFKLRDASGPVVMWVFVFLAITAAIRTLW
jgi:hypothetical protein